MDPAAWLGLLVACLTGAALPRAAAPSEVPLPVRVMIVSAFGPEGQVWREQRELSRAIEVPGLSPEFPEVFGGADWVCQMTTGMGHANAAASIMAMAFSGRFDLRRTYWPVAGMNPKAGHGAVEHVERGK